MDLNHSINTENGIKFIEIRNHDILVPIVDKNLSNL
jgi:hypothetical protein